MEYNNLDKINEKDLIDDVVKQKRNNAEKKSKMIEQLKQRRTNIVIEYLQIVDRKYIEEKITRGIANGDRRIVIKLEAIDYSIWPEKSNNFRHIPIIDRYATCNEKLRKLDIFHEQLGKTVDLEKSIVELIADIVPDDYRVYALYGLSMQTKCPIMGTYRGSNRRFEITLRRESCWCNDPCCYYLCFKNMFCLNSYWCLGDDEPDSCHWTCCCGP